jgi:hypothetical protein
MNIAQADKEIRALARRLGVKAHQVRAALESLDEEAPTPVLLIKANRTGNATMATAADMAPAKPVEKFNYVRWRPLCEAFRLIPCQNCGSENGTVCGAHSNWAVHGKGRNIKASDIYQASLCHTCHSQLDQGSRLSERERKHLWWAAHTKSVPLLIDLGHWPAHIEPPNITDWPF